MFYKTARLKIIIAEVHMSNSNYFDKFIQDQLQRAEANNARKQEHARPEQRNDKRTLLRRYRERVANLITRNVRNG